MKTEIKEKIERYVMYNSFQERKKRDLIQYKKEISRLHDMEIDAIDMEYINVKSEYEHKKNIFAVFMLSILISALMGVWKYFYIFMEKTIRFNASYQGSETETAKVAFILSVIIVTFITIMFLIILIIYMKRMHRLYKNLMMLEEERDRRKS